jgi:hypothetical protein
VVPAHDKETYKLRIVQLAILANRAQAGTKESEGVIAKC